MFQQLDSQTIESLRPSVDRPAPGDEVLEKLTEQEAIWQDGKLRINDVLTLFLRGSECSFRCLMCDLWKYTHNEPARPGSIPAQIESALQKAVTKGQEHAPRWIKLYNASNFFSSKNVPTSDLDQIASVVGGFERVIVENHPKLLSDAIASFQRSIDGELEVAMGLESIHPAVLPRLNKKMNSTDFQRACERLQNWGIQIRAFVLLRAPGLSEAEGLEWCLRSIDFRKIMRRFAYQRHSSS